MNRNATIERILKEYKFNKARIAFLENQMKRLTPETYNECIESKMFAPGYSGAVVKFVSEGGEEVARLNKVEETAEEYSVQCKREYNNALTDISKELAVLKYLTGVVEDILGNLERIDRKYKVILENYYINNTSMEHVAEAVHLSRSRCYELNKEAIEWGVRIVYGENLIHPTMVRNIAHTSGREVYSM